MIETPGVEDRSTYDALVVGAGPAGSLTARELARRGLSVLLVDRATFPRPKVCGCCVNPRALESLGRSGLGGLADRLGAVPLTGLELASGGRRALILQELGVAVSREAFDAALIETAIEAGAAFSPATTATLLPAEPWARSRALRLRRDGQEEKVAAWFVVSATGLADSLVEEGRERQRPRVARSKIGAGAIAPEMPAGFTRQRIYMACGDAGYVGLVALEDGRLDLAAALEPAAVRGAGGIGPLAARILTGSGLPEVPGAAGLAWKGTPPLTRTARRLAGGRVFRVGDAAGYVEPFTGEGMAWAIAGAARLAAILAGAIEKGDEAEAERAWPLAYRREVTARQLVCRSARIALGHPRLTRGLVRILDAWPQLARPLIRTIHHAP